MWAMATPVEAFGPFEHPRTRPFADPLAGFRARLAEAAWRIRAPASEPVWAIDPESPVLVDGSCSG